jgi:hypothetical protein
MKLKQAILASILDVNLRPPSDDTLEVITTSKGRRKSLSGPRMTLGDAARARMRLIFRPTGIFVEAPFIVPASKASSSGAARLHQ